MKASLLCRAGAALSLALLPPVAAADPADDFGWVLVAEVNEGAQMADVDALIAEIVDAARGNPGTLTFNFARVGSTIYGYEMFDDEAAFFGHFSSVEPLMPRLMELWTPTMMIPTHPLPDQIAAIMQPLGAVEADLTAPLARD
jgi:quinol monooxygenase YgiN